MLLVHADGVAHGAVCPRLKRAVADAASNDSNNIAAIGHP